ncbi:MULTISPECIES: dihydrodipicolinate synthase family protein [unclassified Zunongwangia]|uniref:dihydrodipicolinate synthase family protein n=1 Tax=unclassified Zunongwangia TaxID=2632541 RepID=UPI0022DDC40D|nr:MULTISPECIES: dihydrodipicolinate synthase family protein [unclassified Zunongwangia]WBL23352.1 dihydrodipicolinate synthase family protein [Zunongwangia sp. HRR-M8]WBL24702.1 dihydrodipicolinate synthase family protein [Zunongwangia sp. HGR-M22]
MTNNTENQFRGIIPPMITPLNNESELDLKGLKNLIEHILKGGVHGLFILGTTGESASLPYALRHRLIEETCDIVKSRVPVLVGITDTAVSESLKLAETAKQCCASALVAAPPYYFSLGQPELIEYYEYLADRLPLPLFLYNMPSHTKINIEPDTVSYLSRHEKIIGLKDSSGNTAYFNKLLHKMKDQKNFALFVGPEEVTAETVMLGGAGGVNGGANMFPRLYVELYSAAVAGDIETVRNLHELVMEISAEVYSLGKYGSSYLKGLKCALNLMGICSDFMSSPLHRFNQQEKDQLQGILHKIQKKLR